jgi:hypothetical protein
MRARLIRALGVFSVVDEMLKKVILSILLIFAFGNDSTASANELRQEVFTGAVIAYYQNTALAPCVGICFSSFIVRVNKPSHMRDQYILVLIGYRKGEFPNKLVERKRTLRLRLTRMNIQDSPLREFVRMIDSETGQELPSKLRAWRLIAGAESERLSFGEAVPTYLLIGDVSKLLDRV